MVEPVARLSAFARWLPFAAGCAAIWTLSAMPQPPVPNALLFPHSDKLMHAAAYGGLALLAAVGTRGARLVVAWALTVGWGILDELHQWFVPGRQASALDALADAGGAALPLLVLVLAMRRRAPQPS